MTEETNNPYPKQTLMGHIRLLPKIIFFGMVAYGFIRVLMWIIAMFEGKN